MQQDVQTEQLDLAQDEAALLADTFSALADPTRVRILAALAAEELCVGDLAEMLDLSLSALSHQLAMLRRLRIVRSRRDGRHIFYTLDDDHIVTIFRCGLEHIHGF